MTEEQLEHDTLTWPFELGYAVHIAHDGPKSQRGSHGDVVLTERLQAAIARLKWRTTTIVAITGSNDLNEQLFGVFSLAQDISAHRDTLLPRLISGQLRLLEATEMAQS